MLDDLILTALIRRVTGCGGKDEDLLGISNDLQ